MRAKLLYNASLNVCADAVLDQVKQNRERYNKNIIIVPEKYTLICEKQLLNVLNLACSFDCEVVSINRLCARVFGINEVLDKQGGTMLIQKILQENSSDLSYFKNMYSKLGFAENLYQTIMQFKASGISPDDISLSRDNKILEHKLQDIKFVYQKYEQYISMGYTDGMYKLKELINSVKTHSFFSSAAFYFAYFEAFTYYELEFVRALIENNNFCVVGCRYALGQANEHIFTNSIYAQMSSLFLEKGLREEVEVKNVLPNVFEIIKNKLFSFSPQPYPISQQVKIYSATDQSEEVRHVFKLVHYLIAQEGYNCRDINIAVPNLKKYAMLIKKELINYDYNYYLDLSTSLENTSLGNFLTAMLECDYYYFMPNDFFNLVNNYYFGLEAEKTAFLSELILKYNIQGISYLSDIQRFENDKDLSVFAQQNNINIEELLTATYQKCTTIKNVFSKCKTSFDFSLAIFEMLDYFNVFEKTKQLIDRDDVDINDKKVLEQLQHKLSAILEQIKTLDICTPYTSYEFSKLLQTGLQACKINLVPLSLDAIYIADAHESSFEKRKVMIMMGVNYGINPNVKDDVGLISDREIDALSTKYALEPKVSELNMRSRLKIYENCLTATDKLVLYYCKNTDSGESLKPSPLINAMKALFTKNGVQLTDESCEQTIINGSIDEAQIKLWLGNEKTAKNEILSNVANNDTSYFKAALSALKPITNIDMLLKNANKCYDKPQIENLNKCIFKVVNNVKTLSYTQVKEYLSCPFKHFVKRGLKIKEKKTAEINNLDVGTILHKFAELFVRYAYKNDKAFSKDEIVKVQDKIVSEVKEEFEGILSLNSNVIIASELIKEGKRLIIKLNDNLSKTLFKPSALIEYSFSNYLINTKRDVYQLTGTIDRVDVFEDKAFILDYKTGNAIVNIKDIYYGDKIQVLLYATALKNDKNKNLDVVGVGYFPIKNTFIKEENIDTSHLIDGFFASSNSVIESLDIAVKDACNEGDKVQSNIYNFYKQVKKGGEISFSSKVISEEQLNTLYAYANELIKNVLEEIEQGYIEAKPDTDACNYCEYACICNKELVSKTREQTSKNLNYIEEVINGVSNTKPTQNS